MSMVEAVVQQQPLENVGKRPEGVPAEPHLPAGKPLRSVQPLPIPLISHNDTPRPPFDGEAMRKQVALSNAEINGTGIIVDTHA
ncbi:MAG: hypothetical protein KKF77_06300 [Proteobacteria bacterium]|nr:hypothetical protein [Pseudomonadota bacterium]